MSYKLVYTQSAARDIKKLDSIVRKRLGKKILAFSKKPLVHAKKLTHLTLGTYRWRIGDYRVVFDINGKTIVILRVGHRREIYR